MIRPDQDPYSGEMVIRPGQDPYSGEIVIRPDQDPNSEVVIRPEPGPFIIVRQ